MTIVVEVDIFDDLVTMHLEGEVVVEDHTQVGEFGTLEDGEGDREMEGPVCVYYNG
jgi:hypothetical protein